MPPPLPLQLEFLSTTFAANGKRNGVESVIVGVERGGVATTTTGIYSYNLLSLCGQTTRRMRNVHFDEAP